MASPALRLHEFAASWKMGDWDKMFGDSSAESVIAGINASWQSERDYDARGPYKRPPDRREPDSYADIYFENYQDVREWDDDFPDAEFVRKPDGTGFKMKVAVWRS